MRSRSARNLNDGLKLVEKSTATLLKKDKTNKELEPVKSKKLFLRQKLFNKPLLFIYIVILSRPFQQCCGTLFP